MNPVAYPFGPQSRKEIACWSVFRFFLLNFRSRETVCPSYFMTSASGSSAALFGASAEAANTTKATLQIILFICYSFGTKDEFHGRGRARFFARLQDCQLNGIAARGRRSNNRRDEQLMKRNSFPAGLPDDRPRSKLDATPACPHVRRLGPRPKTTRRPQRPRAARASFHLKHALPMTPYLHRLFTEVHRLSQVGIV